MRKSRIIEEWREEGRVEGEVIARREHVLLLLLKRFTILPPELIRRIEAETDPKKLTGYLDQVLDINSPDELKL